MHAFIRAQDAGDLRLKTVLKRLVKELNLTTILTPSQSIIFSDIDPSQKSYIEGVLKEHGVVPIEEVRYILLTCQLISCSPLSFNPSSGGSSGQAQHSMSRIASVRTSRH